MKSILAIALLAASVVAASAYDMSPMDNSKVEHVWENTTTAESPGSATANDTVTNTIGAWESFLGSATTNLIIVPYAISSSDFKKFGAGLAVGYKLSDNVVPTLRIDYYDGKLWMPSGNIQLQVPFQLGSFTLIPFAFTGVAVPVNGGTTASVVGMVGTGAALRLGKSFDLLADYEIWSSIGNQIRLGIGWKPNGW